MKFTRFLIILYLSLVLISVFIFSQPNKSVFAYKKSIDKQTLHQDSGFSYRFTLSVNPFFFHAKDLALFENGSQMVQASVNTPLVLGKNSYMVNETKGGIINVFFVSSDFSIPYKNGRDYNIAIPICFLSPHLGIYYLLIILAVPIWLLSFALGDRDRLQTILQSPKGILTVSYLFLLHISQTFKYEKEPIRKLIGARGRSWRRIFGYTILSAYLYILLEWIFLTTKPSFTRTMNFQTKLEIMVIGGLVLSFLSALAIAAFIVLDCFFTILRRPGITRNLIAIVPSIILTTLSLLMIDNFTYTVFKFGISTSSGVWRGLYGLLFVLMFIGFFNLILRITGLRGEPLFGRKLDNRFFYLAIFLMIISTFVTLIKINNGTVAETNQSTETRNYNQLPNVIILGSDGVNADNMSVYGYVRETTPVLEKLADSSLMAVNAFSNASVTLGSVTSMLTGKLPTQTRVLYSPDILEGIDSYQHLPGLLKTLGYTTEQFGIPNYLDAYTTNMKNGFDVANGRPENHGLLFTTLESIGYDNAVYFLNTLSTRAFDRLQHISYLHEMQNPFTVVTQPTREINDEEKINGMLDLIEKSQGPVFIHAHLMGTHGPKFEPAIIDFSTNEVDDEDWKVDFYDDAILSFDHYVGEVIDRLKVDGEYENTILIIYSDHGMGYIFDKRVPLIIHFPGDAFKGKIDQNVQNLDIAPTILNFLNISKPTWMTGISLINTKLDVNRLIFSASPLNVTKNENGVFILNAQQVKPPFYQFSMVNVIDCQKWYQIDFPQQQWKFGSIAGYDSPCGTNSLLTFNKIKQEIFQQLTEDNFDTTSLRK
jgi:arylsulfatase A-like enzyme